MLYQPKYDTTITFKVTKGQKDFLKRYGKLYQHDTLTDTLQAILNEDYLHIIYNGFTDSALGRSFHRECAKEENCTVLGDPLENFNYLQKIGSGYVPEERPISDAEFRDMINWYEYFKEEAERTGEEFDDIDPRENPEILKQLDRNMDYHYHGVPPFLW